MNLQALKSIKILSESVTVDVTPLSRYGNQNDIAKITTNIQLIDPLLEDTKFLIPNLDGVNLPKIYLPDGSKVDIGDFDPTAEIDLNQLKEEIPNFASKFADDPSDENMKQTVDAMATFSEYKKVSQIINVPAGQKYITFSYSKYIPQNESTGEFVLETIVPLSNFSISNTPGSKANIIVIMPFEIVDPNNIMEAKWTIPNSGTFQDLIKGNTAGRITLSQYWQYDPAVFIKYKY